MYSDDTAVKVENLSKCFEIYNSPRDRLKQFLLPGLQRFFGKEPRKYFREFWAIQNVSFEIKRGETVGIIGKNGSGKSTLLQMICGTLNPNQGSVQTNGRIAALLELGSGFNPEFTGRENVYMNASILGLSTSQIDDCFDDILRFADIGEFIDRSVKTYSSGMYVRLAFAVAINVKPDILVVDEALSVGDIRFQSKCIRAIEDIKKNGASILFVTHSPGQIEALCDRAIWINDGVIKEDGLPKKLMRRYINFMTHGIEGEHDDAIESEQASLGESIEASLPSDWIEISSANNLSGDFSAKIKKVRIRQEDGRPLDVVQTKVQTIEVTIALDVKSIILRPLIAIGIFNSLNEPIIHFNTEIINAELSPLSANSYHEFEANFKIPSLRPGDYLVSIGLDDGISGRSTVVCHVYDAWPFVVIPSKATKAQGGYVQIEISKETIVHAVGGPSEAASA